VVGRKWSRRRTATKDNEDHSEREQDKSDRLEEALASQEGGPEARPERAGLAADDPDDAHDQDETPKKGEAKAQVSQRVVSTHRVGYDDPREYAWLMDGNAERT